MSQSFSTNRKPTETSVDKLYQMDLKDTCRVWGCGRVYLVKHRDR